MRGQNTDTKLYVSVDGVLRPLGYSQVVRLISALAKRGQRYALLTGENPRDLTDDARVRELREELAACGVRWTPIPWHNGGTSIAARNMARLFVTAASLVANGTIELLHCRGYHAAMVGNFVSRATGIPYLFDARGYWVDERAEGGRWFSDARVLRAARRVERSLYERAAGIVTLTDLQRADLRSGSLGFQYGGPIEVITTCADYEEFRPDLVPEEGPWDAIPAVRDSRPLVSVIGSINPSYRTRETLELARLTLLAWPGAHLLVLTHQQAEFGRLLHELALPATRWTVASADHRDMPQWLLRTHWNLSLLVQTAAKRASMPTKLGELFAAGVRPAFHGCNLEATDWVRRARSGVVIESLEQDCLARAAKEIATARPTAELLAARESTADHFSLRAGLSRYEGILNRLVARPATNQPSKSS